MRLAVLAAANSWYTRDLQRAAEEAGTPVTQIVPLPFAHLSSHLAGQQILVGVADSDPHLASGTNGSHSCRSLAEFDALLVRTMPPGSLEQVVFRMDALAALESQGLPVFNPPKAMEVAVDKYLALVRLQADGLPIPQTVVCQTASQAEEAMIQLGGDVVLKPLFGSEGRGITRLTDPEVAHRAFVLLERLGAVLYLQEFLPHAGFDLRCLVIGDLVLGMRRRHPTDWRTNISRGGIPEAWTPDEHARSLALRASAAIGAPIVGVDLLPDQEERLVILEVNAVPGWRALARVSGVDVAAAVLNFVGGVPGDGPTGL